MELKIDQQINGARILFGDTVRKRRQILNELIAIAEAYGFQEIELPLIEPAQIYTDKAGDEIKNQMYTFKDKGDRDICLRPEGTATIQLLADKHWKGYKDLKLWYFTKCYRYERPQAGRYREFHQFGVEVINPSKFGMYDLIQLASLMVRTATKDYQVHESVKRGLNYYTEPGFEITCEQLGAQKQICGGGAYKQGIGFAIGFDRLTLLNK